MIELCHHIVLAKQHVGSISGLYIDQSTRFAAADNDVHHSAQAAVAIAFSRIFDEFYSYNLLGRRAATSVEVATIPLIRVCTLPPLASRPLPRASTFKCGMASSASGRRDYRNSSCSSGGYYNHAVYLLRDIAARYYHLVQCYRLFFQDNVSHLHSALGSPDDNLFADVTDIRES